LDEPTGIRLIVAYDGAGFAGFQQQPRQRTVQGVLGEAIARMDGGEVEVRFASRTDAGVHAVGQIVAFDPTRGIEPYGWMRGLNGELPDDVAVRSAERCPRGYAPRFDATHKHYRYLVQVGAARDPLMRRSAWYLHPGMVPIARSRGNDDVRRWLDLAAMTEAAEALTGTHDFASFQAANDPREDTVRTMSAITCSPAWHDRPDLLALDVHGTAFLKNMVRILAGTLVEVGRGRATPTDVRALLAAKTRTEAGPTAPAHGLTLVSITLGR
jgi:tRNA pseudouridine38-40 synthase